MPAPRHHRANAVQTDDASWRPDLPQPYARKVTSLRRLTGELTAQVTMLSEVITDLAAGDRGYQVIQQLPGIGPQITAAESYFRAAQAKGRARPWS